MKVTAYVTRDIGRTFGVTHGPITRSDPIRSDPALLQLHRWSPSHHGVTQVTRGARDSATVVAPSPVTTPDAMMSLTAIEHLDFTPTCDAQTALAACTRPAWALVGHLCHTCRTGRSWICRPCRDDTRTGWACAHCGLVMDARYMLIVAVL